MGFNLPWPGIPHTYAREVGPCNMNAGVASRDG